MANRSTVNSHKDKQYFSHTAKTTKEINVSPKIMRGGTRL